MKNYMYNRCFVPHLLRSRVHLATASRLQEPLPTATGVCIASNMADNSSNVCTINLITLFSIAFFYNTPKKTKTALCRNLIKSIPSILMVRESLQPLIKLQCPCSNTAASMGFYHTTSPHPSHHPGYKDMHSCCPVAQKLNVT